MIHQKGFTIVEVFIVVFALTGLTVWCWNAVKLASCDFKSDYKIVVMSEKLKAARRWAASQEDAPDTDWAHGYDAAKRHLLLLIGIDVAISAGEDSGDDTFRK